MHRLAIALLLAGITAGAHAQRPSADTATQLHQAADAMDCRQLAAMKNAPMSVQACEQARAAGLDLAASMAVPGDARGADAGMTCEQIAQEIATLQVAGVSDANVVESLAAGEQLQRTQQSAHAAAKTMAARQTLETAAAAGGSNALAGAVAMRQHAEAQALARTASARSNAAYDRALGAQAAAMGDLAASMRANPRWAALLQMGAARCADHPLFNGTSTP